MGQLNSDVNVVHTMRDACKQEASRLEIRAYSGRGIITASEGSKRMLQTLTSVSILRKSCNLPVELFYADADELTSDQIHALSEFGVKCINVQAFPTFGGYDARNFSIKALALYLSSFEEVIWMDADIIPLKNMEDLFDIPSYKRDGQFFFEDIFSYGKTENAMTQSTRKLFERFGVKMPDGTPETDSGLFLIHKGNVPTDFIAINLVLNMQHTVLYKHVYGDKELYRLSMALCDRALTTNDVFPRIIGKFFEKERLMCGNGVVLHTHPTSPVAIHMTLHSVDHHDTYQHFWKESFWTHWVPYDIDVELRIVEPLNQEIIPKYEYDYKRVRPISNDILYVQKEMFKFIHLYDTKEEMPK